jgi:hypothetical protein
LLDLFPPVRIACGVLLVERSFPNFTLGFYCCACLLPFPFGRFSNVEQPLPFLDELFYVGGHPGFIPFYFDRFGRLMLSFCLLEDGVK